ncbi:pentapeptide repeat-containing protein [Crocosphaera watsonii]|nr:Pentapeptide repeat [Crocosphaera watsonii WH 8501]
MRQEKKSYYTNLQAANLARTDFQGANMKGVDLSRANLMGANLKEAKVISKKKFPTHSQNLFVEHLK